MGFRIFLGLQHLCATTDSVRELMGEQQQQQHDNSRTFTPQTIKSEVGARTYEIHAVRCTSRLRIREDHISPEK